MARRLKIALTLGGLLALCAAGFGAKADRKARLQSGAPTFNREVVRIFQQNCQSCHHPGDIAPFSLVHYRSARPWAVAIREQVLLRRMPPWKPVAGCGEFRETRALTDAERATIVAWVDAGAPEGDPSDLPPPLDFSAGWSLGEPDLVLSPPEKFAVPPGRDLYRCFSLPVTMRGDRFASAIDVQPGNRRIVHHVIAFADPTGASAALDAQDPGPGYSCFGGPGFGNTNILAGWAPGFRASEIGAGIGLKLTNNSRVVMQVHYYPAGETAGQAVSDQTRLGFYFARQPVRQELLLIPLLNSNFTIPAGAKDYEVTAGFPFVPFNAHLISIGPHMHLLGRRIRVELTKPLGSPECLVRIDDWDFNWQSFYYYREPIAIPSGSQVKVTASYDNSADNPRNPNSPPKPVSYGEATTDEMCLAIAGVTMDGNLLPVSSPQITSVTVEAGGRLVVGGTGFLAGAEIEINGRVARDTTGASTLSSDEGWKVFAPPGQAVNVTVLNPDGAHSPAHILTRPGTALVATTVSAASFAGGPVSPEAIVAAFGAHLATGIEGAAGVPLPTQLAGTRVRVNGALAPLFYAGPGQINFLIPATTSQGTAVVEITASDGTISRGEVTVAATASSLFTANFLGTGAPAALVTADGVNYRAVGNADGTPNEVNAGEVLVLFGTGIRHAVAGAVEIKIGNAAAVIDYVGAHSVYEGLDQINARVPSGVTGLVDLMLSVDGRPANTVRVMVR